MTEGGVWAVCDLPSGGVGRPVLFRRTMRRTTGLSPAHRGLRLMKVMAAVTASISASALVSSATARADTLSSDKAQAAAITAHLSQLQSQEAAADERYNKAQITLTGLQARETQAKEAEQTAA